MTRPFGSSAKELLMSAPFSVALRLPVPALRISTSASPPLIRSGWLESTLIVGPVLAGSFASEKDEARRKKDEDDTHDPRGPRANGCLHGSLLRPRPPGHREDRAGIAPQRAKVDRIASYAPHPLRRS